MNLLFDITVEYAHAVRNTKSLSWKREPPNRLPHLKTRKPKPCKEALPLAESLQGRLKG
ncbi:MAG: hypothetical protein JRF52_10375 [Deltaproteobacteria bacterium]|nr:hypothetical protein [Deltaproteobacteria bacterium]